MWWGEGCVCDLILVLYIDDDYVHVMFFICKEKKKGKKGSN